MARITPDICPTPEAARDEIDRLDRELLRILQQRHLFGERIAALRGERANDSAMEHFLDFMKDRRKWGRLVGLEAEYVDRVFFVIAQRYFDQRMADAGPRARTFR